MSLLIKQNILSLLFYLILHSPIDIPLCRILPMFNNARITKHNRMARHIAVNITIRRNQHIIPNSYLANNSSIYTYPNLVTNNRSSLSPPLFVCPMRTPRCMFIFLPKTAFGLMVML